MSTTLLFIGALLLISVIWIWRQTSCSSDNFTCVAAGKELEELASQQPAIIYLDVRTPGEITSGKIPNAKEIDVTGGQFTTRLTALPKDATYVVYCRSGLRSAKACRMMAEQGFTNLYNLKGGYQAWSKNESQ